MNDIRTAAMTPLCVLLLLVMEGPHQHAPMTSKSVGSVMKFVGDKTKCLLDMNDRGDDLIRSGL
jgi:hypothetical protein